MAEILLDIDNLPTQFDVSEGTVRAVDGLSLRLQRGETLGIVGESGCGKSVMALSILQIVPWPGKIASEQIRFFRDGAAKPPVHLTRLKPKGEEIRAIRGSDIAVIFQDPMTALSPIHTIGRQIVETITTHQKRIDRQEARRRAVALLHEVGIPNPERRVYAYTFELSGGMRQRAMIAMALSCNPQLLIADEPTTAIDDTIQVQILDLIRRVQREHGMALIMITHDLGVIAELCHRVAVMYLGRVVEEGPIDRVYQQPLHPYTQALLDSIPHVGEELEQPGQRLMTIEGRYRVPPSDCRDAPSPRAAGTRSPDSASSTCRSSSSCSRGIGFGASSTVRPGRRVMSRAGDAGSEGAVAEADTAPAAGNDWLLKVVDLKTHYLVSQGVFRVTGAVVRAVDGVSFTLQRNETLGIVGESGCGKSTVAKTILGIVGRHGAPARADHVPARRHGNRRQHHRHPRAAAGAQARADGVSGYRVVTQIHVSPFATSSASR